MCTYKLCLEQNMKNIKNLLKIFIFYNFKNSLYGHVFVMSILMVIVVYSVSCFDINVSYIMLG